VELDALVVVDVRPLLLGHGVHRLLVKPSVGQTSGMNIRYLHGDDDDDDDDCGRDYDNDGGGGDNDDDDDEDDDKLIIMIENNNNCMNN